MPTVHWKCQPWTAAQQVGRSFPEGYGLGVVPRLHISPSTFGGLSSGQSHLSSPEALLLFHRWVGELFWRKQIAISEELEGLPLAFELLPS